MEKQLFIVYETLSLLIQYVIIHKYRIPEITKLPSLIHLKRLPIIFTNFFSLVRPKYFVVYPLLYT